jgi:hypothetical protein
MSIVLVGSTSGSITLQEPAVAGTTVLDLPATSGTVLTSASQSIPKAALPTGSVLQVVNATTSTPVTTATTTYVDTGLTASITPTSSSSKILVLIAQNGVSKLTNNTGVNMRLLRGATSIVSMTDIVAFTGTSTDNRGQSISLCYLDSPATTSSTTYKTQFMSYNNNATVIMQDGGTSISTSTITLMEIAA